MIHTGLDVLLENPEIFRGKRTALLANQTTVTRDLVYGWEALRASGIRLLRVFSPEHGVFSTEQDQVPVGEQEIAGIPLVSLYGDNADSLVPDRSLLEDIDLFLFDIQDVGARYYTYVNTMAMVMRHLRGLDVEFAVLDRPNPLGGTAVEGPPLCPGFESFVGVHPVPVRHGLTAGELATMYNKEQGLDVNLTVFSMRGWSRDRYFDQTGLPWIPPSPNMPTLATALVYPGMCLLEGTNLSEGRGTTTPFEMVGAPWVDADDLARNMNEMNLPGTLFRAVSFRPTFNKFSNQLCYGVFIHVMDRTVFSPFFTGIALVKSVRDLYGDLLEFTRGVYEFNEDHPAFDLLAGGGDIRTAILDGRGIDDIRGMWRGYEEEFSERRREFLLYGRG